jgi:DNA-binding transcriptional ArsR family regulator
LADADRDNRQLADLVQAFRCVYDTVIAPDWTQVEAYVEADRALRARALRDGGVSRLLTSLGTAVRWDPPVLYVRYPVERDLHLSGRGLRLVPSRFCSRVPVALADPQLRPVLVYPVGPTANEPVPRSASALDGLLGRTRAEVLRALRDGATTGELASRLRVSASAASQHVHVLSRAGLVHSQRTGASILHTLTPLGTALLTGSVPVLTPDQRISDVP